jgi:protein-tyrosine phosphatase
MTCIDANEIAPGLWQGSIPPTGSELKRSGYTAVVLCAWEYQYKGGDHLFPGVRVIRAPNRDSKEPPTEEELRVAISAAQAAAQEVVGGGKVLVTCVAGMNRSGLVSALALHLLYGWPGTECIKQVRRMRNQFTNLYQHPLGNQHFVRSLCSLQRRPPMITVPKE